MITRQAVLSIAALCSMTVASRALAADEWPQFRGPTGQGLSDAVGLPVSWSETDNLAWKTPLPGCGWSSPVISGERIWMTTAALDGAWLGAVCVDRSSGEIVRQVEVFRPSTPAPKNAKNSYASPSPVIEDGRLYVHYGTLGTACLDAASSSVLWTNEDLKLDHKEGPGSSPVVWNDLLLIHCDGTDVQFVVALDKHTGGTVWQAPRTGVMADNADHRKAYSTPLVIEAGERSEAISPTSDRVIAYDPARGDELWRVEYNGFSNVPRPVFAHGLAYVCTGYPRPQLLAIRPGGSGDVTSSHIAWRCESNVPANPSPIVVGDEIYFVNDKGIATCLDARTGRTHWMERLGSNFSASPLAAEGRVYFLNEAGECFVVRASATFEMLAANQIDGRVLASLAVAGKALFLRSETHLYRIENR